MTFMLSTLSSNIGAMSREYVDGEGVVPVT